MFIEITKINSHNEQGKALIKTEDIVGIKQNHVEGTKLYDDQGNLVSETPATTKDFTLLMVNGKTFHIDENEYARLVQELTKQLIHCLPSRPGLRPGFFMPNEIDRRTQRHRAIDDPAADPSGRKKRTTLVVLNKS